MKEQESVFEKEILARTQRAGFRRSVCRERILKILLRAVSPLTVPDIIEKITRKDKREYNKTTIYREIEILKNFGAIREVALGDRAMRYEIMGEHHHHLVCTVCGEIRHIRMKESIRSEEKRIAKKEGFSGVDHSLEFYGVCGRCA